MYYLNFLFAHSHFCYRDEDVYEVLTQTYGESAVRELLRSAQQCTVMCSNDMAIVTTSAGDVCVRRTANGRHTCSCKVFKKLKFCGDVLAVLFERKALREYVMDNGSKTKAPYIPKRKFV